MLGVLAGGNRNRVRRDAAGSIEPLAGGRFSERSMASSATCGAEKPRRDVRR
ncbi:MAG: hypothetical protein HRT86_15950 [Ilumatobacteraceae bacterium]|nr:hypothetical protein [Ilumatobacteraceae bacterium]